MAYVDKNWESSFLEAIWSTALALLASKNYSELYPIVLTHAEQAEVWAEFLLGKFYGGVFNDVKEIVPIDYKASHQWYLKASEQGIVSAFNNIGVLYAHGLGVE